MNVSRASASVSAKSGCFGAARAAFLGLARGLISVKEEEEKKSGRKTFSFCLENL